MIIYEALYNPMIHESSYATLSLHRTKEGAEKAVQEHQDKIKKEHDDQNKEWQENGMEKSRFDWDFCQSWSIAETELLD